jgi:hypothetical protein
MGLWVKDPDDVAWYEFDWSDTDEDGNAWLPTGVTIASYTVTVDDNLTKVADASTDTTVSVNVSGGTVGTQSLVTCQVVTSASNTYETEKYIVIATRQS